MNAVLKPPKAKKCRACGAEFTPARMGQRVCASYRCVLDYMRLQAEAKKLKEQRVAKRERKGRLDQLKSLSTLCSEAQKDVNRFVRARDWGMGCISCGTGGVEDAGHFFPIGSKWRTSRLRFNVSLIHGQCRSCNSFKGGGNLHGYIEGIKRRFGEGYLESMYEAKRAAEHGELEPLTKDEVRAIAASYRELTRGLVKARVFG